MVGYNLLNRPKWMHIGWLCITIDMLNNQCMESTIEQHYDVASLHKKDSVLFYDSKDFTWP